MSKQKIGVVANIDSSGNARIVLDNGNVVQVDDVNISNDIQAGDAIHGKTFSISGTASFGGEKSILDEVVYDG